MADKKENLPQRGGNDGKRLDAGTDLLQGMCRLNKIIAWLENLQANRVTGRLSQVTWESRMGAVQTMIEQVAPELADLGKQLTTNAQAVVALTPKPADPGEHVPEGPVKQPVPAVPAPQRK